jgi:hypothetical protein
MFDQRPAPHRQDGGDPFAHAGIGVIGALMGVPGFIRFD